MPDTVPAAVPIPPAEARPTQLSTALDSAARLVDAATSTTDRVSKWGPQQVITVGFVAVLAAIVIMLGWSQWVAAQDKRADREAYVVAQAQLLRYIESETEKSRMAAAGETEKARAFYAVETEKARTFYALSEKSRADAAQFHMKEALDQLEKLRNAINGLRGKIADGPTAPSP